MLLSVSYLAPMQNWLVFNSVANNSIQNQMVNGYPGVTGIRHIVSTKTVQIEAQNPIEQQYNAPTETVKKTLEDKYSYVYRSPQAALSTNNTLVEEIKSETTLAIQRKKLPLIVELDDELIIEFTADYSYREMQRAVSRLLVMASPLDARKMLTKQSIDTKKRPYFHHRILNQYNKEVRYPAQAYRYAEYLLMNSAQQINDEQGKFVVLSVPLTNYSLPEKVKSYQAWVDQFSAQHDTSPELIYAIMEVESAFNPRAVSSSNALGLMQIKAGSAGRDVYKHIDGKAGQPNKQNLFNPKENIRIGVAYLGLLKNLYFEDVKNERKKDLLAIASYNGGLSSVIKLFGGSAKDAIERINRLHPKQIYRKLRLEHHSAETRRYIDKVVQAEIKYKDLLGRV